MTGKEELLQHLFLDFLGLVQCKCITHSKLSLKKKKKKARFFLKDPVEKKIK